MCEEQVKTELENLSDVLNQRMSKQSLDTLFVQLYQDLENSLDKLFDAQ
jgi:hypothetical protein